METRSEVQNLQRQLNEARQALRDKESELEAHMEQAASFKKQAEVDGPATLENLRNQVKTLQDEKTALKSELVSAKRGLEDARIQQLKSESKAERVQLELDRLRRHFEDVEIAKVSALDAQEEIRALKQDLAEREELADFNVELEEKNRALVKEAEKAKELAVENRRLRQERSMMQATK